MFLEADAEKCICFLFTYSSICVIIIQIDLCALLRFVLCYPFDIS